MAKSNDDVVLQNDNIILAKVNGSAISQFDLEQNIRTALGERALLQIDADGRRKMLESLVAGRAVALQQEQNLTAEDKAVLDKKVQAYREQLLVKRYMAQKVPPQPVTPEMIAAYYQKHPERFGARTVRHYELIQSSQPLNAGERDKLMALLKDPGSQKDWRGWVAKLSRKGYPLTYRAGQTSAELLHPQLYQIVQAMKKSDPPQFGFIKDVAYVIRINKETRLPPRPLDEVSVQIRKALAPVQLRAAIKQASAQVLKAAKVEYIEK